MPETINTSLSEAPPEEKATGTPFHVAAIESFRHTINEVLAKHPEVRSCTAVLDYRGGLNSAQIDKAIWMGENGPVQDIAAVIGSINNTLLALEVMFVRAHVLEEQLRQRLANLSKEVIVKESDAQTANTDTVGGKTDAGGLSREHQRAVACEPYDDAGSIDVGALIEQTSKPTPEPGSKLPPDLPDTVWYDCVENEVRRDPALSTTWFHRGIIEADLIAAGYEPGPDYNKDSYGGYWHRKKPEPTKTDTSQWPDWVWVSNKTDNICNGPTEHDTCFFYGSTVETKPILVAAGYKAKLDTGTGWWWHKDNNWPDRVYHDKDAKQIREHPTNDSTIYLNNADREDLEDAGYFREYTRVSRSRYNGGYWKRDPAAAIEPPGD